MGNEKTEIVDHDPKAEEDSIDSVKLRASENIVANKIRKPRQASKKVRLSKMFHVFNHSSKVSMKKINDEIYETPTTNIADEVAPTPKQEVPLNKTTIFIILLN